MSDSVKAPAIIERFVKSLVVSAKAVMLYPPSSNVPLQTAEETSRVLAEALRETSELKISIGKSGLFYYDLPVFEGNAAYQGFAYELYVRKLADVRFHAGTSPRDIVAFLSVLKHTPEEVEAVGGFEARLWEQGVATITVTETAVSVIDAEHVEDREVTRSRQEIDDLLAAAYAGRNREQITIARILAEPAAVVRYLDETRESGGVSGVRAMAERFAEMAEVAYESGDESRHELLHSLADALAALEPMNRRDLLLNELLPEARTNEPLAMIVRQFDVDGMCTLLLEQIDESQISQEALARGFRTLAAISAAERSDVMSTAAAAMHAAGVSDEYSSGVLEITAPQHLTVQERARGVESQQAAEAVLRLLESGRKAPAEVSPADGDEVTRLGEEAHRGITDGDVVMAFVSLAVLDTREQQFASMMSLLEDSLDLLIERGELDIAADVVDALRSATDDENLSQEQRMRLGRAISRLAKPADIRSLAQALRLYATGTTEHESAKRLLDAMGRLVIDPLLEQLADEPDMTARKALVDLLAKLAPGHIGELGKHVGDPRWYVVRNVINILGTTKSPLILPHLERTVRHAEPRVRREAIRALSAQRDPLAYELLIAALDDDDAQNVQLAARYLAVRRARQASAALENVARGEGRGNRDIGPRVEAIEALGALGAVESVPTLESLAGKRAIISGSRTRELRAAAESALTRIRTAGGGG